MGGSSRSSTSRSTSTTVTDRRIGATDDAIVATDNASVYVESIDAPLIESVLTEGLGLIERDREHSADLIAKAIDAAIEGASDTAQAAADAYDKALTETAKAYDGAVAASKSEVSQGFSDILKTGTAIAAIAGLAYMASK